MLLKPCMCADISNHVQIQPFTNKEESRVRRMRQILLRLRKACTIYQHSDINTLHPKQKNILHVWEHIQNCRDKDCKRKYCKSSCLILEHYYRCMRSRQCSKCKLCAPVDRYCRRVNQLTYDENCETRKRQNVDQFSINDQFHNALSIESNSKRNRVIWWHANVKGGNEEDSVVPSLCHQTHHMNK